MRTLITLFLLQGLRVAAQPVITSATSPQPGDVCPYKRSHDPFNFHAGPGVTWDLTGVSFDDIPPDTTFYMEASDAPGHAHFPLADLAATDEGHWWYEFYDMSASAWTVIGGYNFLDDTWADLPDSLTVLTYPCTFGTQVVDPYSVIWSDEGILYHDTTEWTMNAYGTLLLPGLEVHDLLGRYRYSTSVDTVGTDVYTEYSEEMQLFSPYSRCEIGYLSSSVETLNGNFFDDYYYARVLDDASIGMSGFAAEPALELWPVPAHDRMDLRWSDASGLIDVQVIDGIGRVVLAQRPALSGDVAAIDVSGLAPGAYLLRATNASGTTLVRAFTVEGW